jgi:hypothetical protein
MGSSWAVVVTYDRARSGSLSAVRTPGASWPLALGVRSVLGVDPTVRLTLAHHRTTVVPYRCE